MTHTSAQDDLAFLRGLTDADVPRKQQALFGRIYFGAGLVYGLQIALSLAHNTGALTIPGGDGALTLAANGAFLPWMCVEFWKHRRDGVGGVTNKAVNAAFAATGATNGALALILILGAWRLEEPRLALLISSVIFALQGTAWFVAYLLRRRAWLGCVAAGWAISSVAMAFFMNDLIVFLGIIAAAIALCMALPGYVMMRLAARAQG